MAKCENYYHRKICIDGANYKNAENCKQYINEADIVEPVKHGHWQKIKGCFYTSTKDGGGQVRKCSLCGEPSPSGYGTPYCAICGAKMNGKKRPYNTGERDVCTEKWKHAEDVKEILKND